MKIHFPEYKDVLGKVDGAFVLELLKEVPFPSDLKLLWTEGIRDIWHAAKRGAWVQQGERDTLNMRSTALDACTR